MDQPDPSPPNRAAATARPSPPRSAAMRLAPEASQRWVEAPADGWSADLLMQFSLSMARHGMSISRLQMRNDPAYALQQIAHARSLEDLALHQLAARLLAH